jgi:hypothetical protein
VLSLYIIASISRDCGATHEEEVSGKDTIIHQCMIISSVLGFFIDLNREGKSNGVLADLLIYNPANLGRFRAPWLGSPRRESLFLGRNPSPATGRNQMPGAGLVIAASISASSHFD